jgi:flagellar hook-associated protein 2
VTSLFGGANGVATQLTAFIDRYSSFSGVVAGSQSQLTLQINNVNDRINVLQARLDKRQSQLEQQLAQQQALLNSLSQQQSQIQSFLSRSF